MNSEFLERTFLGNTVESYCWFAGIILAGLLLKQVISKLISIICYRMLKRYSAGVTIQEFHDLLRRPFSLVILLIIGYLAFDRLSIPTEWNVAPIEKFGVRLLIWKLYLIALIISIARIFLRLVDFFGLILSRRASRTESRVDDQLVPFFRDSLKILLAIFSFFFILGTVFNVNIVTLIGGLGIGGLAVALAAKETLENLFGSFTIFLDKPFIVGDMVRVGDIQGHVETIGLRSTRIRTVDKSLVTVPNKKMVDAELDNITQRSMWRCRQVVSLIYKTTAADLKIIISQVLQFLDNHPNIRNGSTVNFDNLGPSSIDILIVYFVLTSEADVFQAIKEEVNFHMMEIVRSNNSDFAYPTTSVYLEKQTD
jgi:MscS family membrane protein